MAEVPEILSVKCRRSRLQCMVVTAFLLAVAAFPASAGPAARDVALPVRLANPGFDQGLEGWSVTNAGATIEPFVAEGRTLARMASTSAALDDSFLYQDFPVTEGDTVRADALAFRHGLRYDGNVFTWLLFFDAGGGWTGWSASVGVPLEDEWAQLEAAGVAPPGTVRAQFRLVLRGQGEAWFDDASATITPAAPDTFAGAVTLDITDDVACDSFIGCGAQDDGYFYGPDNAAYGVDESDAAIREGRIAWMRPGWVRMFWWYGDWCPSGDWQTFTFDSPNMESHYRTLEVYQRLGSRVNLVGVDWAMSNAYDDPQALVHAIGVLLEYLIRDKGFTCIQDYTLLGEPNQTFLRYGYNFDDYAELERLLHDEFARRGLSVNVVASDEAQSIDLFTRCLNSDTIDGAAGLYSSHFYPTAAERLLAGDFFQDRMDLLALHSPSKPLVMGEFGFADEHTTLIENPVMATYPFAVWMAAFGIEALNHGVSALSVFTLHDSHYPFSWFVTFGLWRYKDQDWAPKPAYYAWAPFTRFARPGATVRRGVSSQPAHVLGTVVGDTLLWVNQGDQPATVTISGFQADDVRIMTETTIHGDRDTGTVEAVTDGTFVAPPQSFGYARPRPFPDVGMNSWAYEEIGAVAAQGIVQGYWDGNYHPERAVTRDQMAAYVARTLAGGDANVPAGPETATFMDVPLDHWAFRYVEYCAAENVVQGYGGNYHPDQEVTRDQMAVYIARALVTPSGDEGLADLDLPSTPSFADVPADQWAYRQIEYCKANGVVQGYADGYHPDEVVTRDQMAVYVTRAFLR